MQIISKKNLNDWMYVYKCFSMIFQNRFSEFTEIKLLPSILKNMIYIEGMRFLTSSKR